MSYSFCLKGTWARLVLGLAIFRVDFERVLKELLGFAVFLLLHQNLAAQVETGGLIRVGGVGLIQKTEGRRQIAALKSLSRRLEFALGKLLRAGGAFGRRGQLESGARFAVRLLHPAHLVEGFGEQFVKLRREILFRSSNPAFRALVIIMLQSDGRVSVLHSRRIVGEFKLGEERVHHVLLAFENVGQQNFVLDELRRFPLKLR